ncbi:MAG TPA: glycoside hydrolase family 2 TIM barrel-domain containing protein [Bryobacteraceae bacterium]|nr:glycoside hydrolase family 2 TIM barrel-domain containing protein [Bryobacteraceae bacterium]
MKLTRCWLALAAVALCGGERATISLDGEWDITDSKAADALPSTYGHKVPVPGLVHSSVPAFPDVDQFDSRLVIQNRVSKGMLPKSAIVFNAGVPRQDRNWFWYRRSVTVPRKRAVAILRINKAQFGAAVWLNGKKIGEHLPCFSAAIFDVSSSIREGENEIVVRVGAHPGVLPESVTAGTDFEKNRWTPGIYDSASLSLSDNPVIETIQVAPRLANSSILVQTKVRNFGAAPVGFSIDHRVHPWKSNVVAGRAASKPVTLKPGEERTIVDTIRLPGAKLWTPEEPNLYVVETSTGGDTASTRFGMREFRFDTATRRAYLNGRVYFMRGSNITLHRFFEDPKSGTLPWDEQWVRKLLVDIPKQMNWNSFRFCIGPAPDKWYDIADEAGLLIQNEYFVWTGHNWHGPENQVHFDADQMVREYSEWMRDNWNHPSVAIWDANNETWDAIFGEKVIPAVRGLDLSNRPWENSYNPPAGPDDPVEDHPYEFQRMAAGGPEFQMTTLEQPGGKSPIAPTGHAMILNEYGWLWLNRDGSPTELTKKLYPRLVGENATAADRLAMNAYLLGGITEYWRAYRQYAGVLHFVYLMSSDPLGYTADHFRNIEKLELDPQFQDYMSHAFAPLGVYLSFWKPTLAAGSTPSLRVMMVNDEARPVEGTLTIALEAENGQEMARKATKFSLAATGQQTYYVDFAVPQTTGRFLLKAIAESTDKRVGGATLSRRRVTVVTQP